MFYPFAFCVGSGSSSSALGWWHEKSARLITSFKVMIWRSSLPVFFCKRKWTRRLGCFCFPVRFVQCKYNTPILKKEYSKPTTFLPKSYQKPTFFKKHKKIGIKSISELFADSLLFLLSIVSLSARYAPCHRIKLSPGASLLCVILALRLLTSLIQRNILVHGWHLHIIIFGCPPIISDGQLSVITSVSFSNTCFRRERYVQNHIHPLCKPL